MAKNYCHDGYSESTDIENFPIDSSDKIIIGGFLLVGIIFAAILWYGTSIEIYPDLTYISIS